MEELAFGKLNVVTRKSALYIILSRASYCSETIDDKAAWRLANKHELPYATPIGCPSQFLMQQTKLFKGQE